MNKVAAVQIYRLTTEAGHSYEKALSPSHIEWYLDKMRADGHAVKSFEVVSTSTDCGGCGCRKSEHFNSTGLCGLGFCAAHCGEFVYTL